MIFKFQLNFYGRAIFLPESCEVFLAIKSLQCRRRKKKKKICIATQADFLFSMGIKNSKQ